MILYIFFGIKSFIVFYFLFLVSFILFGLSLHYRKKCKRKSKYVKKCEKYFKIIKHHYLYQIKLNAKECNMYHKLFFEFISQCTTIRPDITIDNSDFVEFIEYSNEHFQLLDFEDSIVAYLKNT